MLVVVPKARKLAGQNAKSNRRLPGVGRIFTMYL